MNYTDLIHFPRRTASDKLLRKKTFNITKEAKHYRYQRRLTSVDYNFFNKESAATRANKSASANTSGGAIKKGFILNQQLADELLKN